jgi:hypothetical protein
VANADLQSNAPIFELDYPYNSAIDIGISSDYSKDPIYDCIYAYLNIIVHSGFWE